MYVLNKVFCCMKQDNSDVKKCRFKGFDCQNVIRNLSWTFIAPHHLLMC